MRELSYSLTIEDFVAFSLYHLRARARENPFYKRPMVMFGIFLLACSIIGSVTEYVGKGPNAPSYFGAAIFISVLVLIIAAPSHTKRGIIRNLKRSLEDPKVAESFFAETRLGVTAEGVTRTTKLAVNFLRWEAILTVEATLEHVFFYQTSESAFLVPRRAFISDEEFHTFVGRCRAFHGREKDPEQADTFESIKADRWPDN